MDDRQSDVVANGEILETTEVDSANSNFKTGKSEDQVKKYSFNGDINSRVKCTACYRQILLIKPGAVYRHPVLKVLVCKKCYDYYTSGDIKEGEDGVDEQCRWCGDGGKLLGCDYCHNAYCKNCIKTNLGRSELATITGAGKWRCYICDPDPLQNLVKYCSAVISAVQSFHDNKTVPGKSSDNLTTSARVAPGGRCKETPKKKPASSEADNESSDDSSNDGVDDHRIDALFSSKNLKQTVETLKSAVTPLYLALAETEDEIKKLSRTSGSRVASKYETLAEKLRYKYVACSKAYARFRKSKSSKKSADVDCIDKSKRSKSLAAVDNDDGVVTTSGNGTAVESTANVSETSEAAKLSADEGDEVACGSAKKTDAKQPASLSAKGSMLPELKLVRSSRADMDAQRSLHREMLVAGSDDSEESDKDDDDDDSDEDESSDDSEQSSSNSSDDLYDPKQERRDMNAELKTERRVSRNKQMSRTAIRQVKAIRDRIKKNKLKKKKNAKKVQKSDSEEDKKSRKKKKKHGKREVKDDDDDDDKKSEMSDEEGRKKKTGKTKNKSDRKEKKETKGGDVEDDVGDDVGDDVEDDVGDDVGDDVEDDVEDEENGKKKPENSTKKSRKSGRDEERVEADNSSSDNKKSVETADDSKDGNSETKGTSRKEDDESGDEEQRSAKESSKKVKNLKAGAGGDSEEVEGEKGTDEVENRAEDAAGGKKMSKKQEKKQKKSDGKSADAGAHSECSTDHDSDLDKELMVLEKVPKLTIKLGGEKDASRKIGEKSLVVVLEKEDGIKSKSSKDDKITEGGKSTSKAAKAGARRKLIDDLSSAKEDANADDNNDDDGVEELEEENEADTSKTAGECADSDAVSMDVGEDDDAKARKALMDDAEDDIEGEEEVEEEDDEDDADESDSKAEKKAKQTKKKNVTAIDHDSADDFEEISPVKRTSKKRSKLLRAKISDSDDDDESTGDDDEKSTKKKKSSKKKADDDDDDDAEEDSDSDVVVKKKKKNKKRKHSSSSEDEEENSSEDEEKKKGKKHKRRRIKAQSDSSEEKNSGKEGEEGSDDDDDSPAGRKRRKIRKIINTKELSKKTVDAAKAEEERRMRIVERQKRFNQVTVEDTSSPIKCQKTLKLVLEADEETKEPIVEVHKKLICKLKPHQVDAVKFMWNCCIESLERLKKEDGSGCILAHCMGLGKTLSVITFVHTLFEKSKLKKMRTCLVLCPLNTILNWQSEFERWLEDCGQLDVYELSSVKDNWGRSELLNDWQTGGGVMIMGYEMFRNLSQLCRIKNKKQKQIFTETLLNPGPDLIVCDEGHVLKNDSTGLSKATTQIKTKRRIVLTGTPLQNNLVEYHCMVNFVKPNLLGTRKEFCNRFVNPIMNGQCSDSKAYDVKLMKRRAHILHETLAGCVQRKDYSALTKFLLPKNEYVISVRLSKVQIELYEQYLNRLTAGGTDFATQSMKGSRIFTDYQNLMKIWTHPWVLKMDEIRQETRRMNTHESEDSFIDDSEYESDVSTAKEESKSNDDDDGEVQVLGSEDEWKPQRQTRRSAAMEKKKEAKAKQDGSTKDETNKKKPAGGSKDGDDDDNSGSDKGEVVKGWKTRSRGGDKGTEASVEPELPAEPDKVSNEWWAEYVKAEDKFKLELSGKLLILAEILQMAESIGDKVLVFSQSLLSLNLIEAFLAHWDQNTDPETRIAGAQSWDKGIDYVRMDGSTSAQNRKEWAEMFNDPENVKVRLFLISTKAGSLGINLVAANRVVVFDASWNPTHDVQSIFRVYRFGQDKPVYVYRLLAQGTMEEKIYERQVTKQSLAQRVIDEHQIERHFTANDLRELYNFKPDRLDDPDRPQRPTPKLPKDLLLAEILTKLKDWVVQYHEHDSLLENKIEEELSEEERKAAWEEYEQEKKGLLRPSANVNAMMMMQGMPGMPYAGMPTNAYQMQNAVMELNPHRIAQAIYQANPGISQEDLTQRVTIYLRDAQRQRLVQMQQQNDYRLMLERQRLMQMQLEREQMMREAELRNNPSGLAAALLAAGGQRPMSASSALMNMLANSQQAAAGTSSRSGTSRSASRSVSRSGSPNTVAAAAAGTAAPAAADASTDGSPPTSN